MKKISYKDFVEIQQALLDAFNDIAKRNEDQSLINQINKAIATLNKIKERAGK